MADKYGAQMVLEPSADWFEIQRALRATRGSVRKRVSDVQTKVIRTDQAITVRAWGYDHH